MVHNSEVEARRKAYLAGYSAGLSGPDPTNCHFSFFRTRDLTSEWEAGNAKGKTDRAAADRVAS
jgi:ribosome modulation factor